MYNISTQVDVVCTVYITYKVFMELL